MILGNFWLLLLVGHTEKQRHKWAEWLDICHMTDLSIKVYVSFLRAWEQTEQSVISTTHNIPGHRWHHGGLWPLVYQWWALSSCPLGRKEGRALLAWCGQAGKLELNRTLWSLRSKHLGVFPPKYGVRTIPMSTFSPLTILTPGCSATWRPWFAIGCWGSRFSPLRVATKVTSFRNSLEQWWLCSMCLEWAKCKLQNCLPCSDAGMQSMWPSIGHHSTGRPWNEAAAVCP